MEHLYGGKNLQLGNRNTEMKIYHTTYRTFSAPDGTKYSVSEYCVAETAYDEDGEFVSSTIWDISPMPKIE